MITGEQCYRLFQGVKKKQIWLYNEELLKDKCHFLLKKIKRGDKPYLLNP